MASCDASNCVGQVEKEDRVEREDSPSEEYVLEAP